MQTFMQSNIMDQRNNPLPIRDMVFGYVFRATQDARFRSVLDSTTVQARSFYSEAHLYHQSLSSKGHGDGSTDQLRSRLGGIITHMKGES